MRLTTAEGDTVQLSLDVNDLQQFQRGYARTAQDSAEQSSRSEASTIHFEATINGDLNDHELADIKSLIAYLETGKPVDSSLSSLSSYTGAFSQTHSSTNSTLNLQA